MQNIMANALESPAACSAKGWRIYAKSFKQMKRTMNGMVDVNLLNTFINLNTQEELCAAGGTTDRQQGACRQRK
ncbi:hypothetical protein TrCOL_g10654 [Triparma columacea]|uniref:Uncharacterized protein n=1 Tax=Triparma columacea TaxID=722753 RepID=A0A9W7L966_9STRA|nr:hypothetical protein TrCOL_g10654 [Triparma columacea]